RHFHRGMNGPAVLFLTLLRCSGHTSRKLAGYLIFASEWFMQALGLPLLVQICLAVGMAGLLWPDKVKPVFELLMFPWLPTYRALRIHSIGVLGLSFLLFVTWLTRLR